MRCDDYIQQRVSPEWYAKIPTIIDRPFKSVYEANILSYVERTMPLDDLYTLKKCLDEDFGLQSWHLTPHFVVRVATRFAASDITTLMFRIQHLLGSIRRGKRERATGFGIAIVVNYTTKSLVTIFAADELIVKRNRGFRCPSGVKRKTKAIGGVHDGKRV